MRRRSRQSGVQAGGTGGRRTRTRYRARRGGVHWARHGDKGRRALIIGHLNIQSLKPKLPELRAVIKDVYGFHILGLCETWLSPNTPSRLLNVPGYQLYRADRPTQRQLSRRCSDSRPRVTSSCDIAYSRDRETRTIKSRDHLGADSIRK